MIISLTGFMGCGKSSVGRELSKLLCCRFMDLDDVIVERAGRSIPEIFAQDGEKVFRQMELEALQHVIESDHDNIYRTPSEERSQDVVVALGGGAVMTKECAEIVKERTTCIYLRASVETLLEHLEGHTDNRPLLNSRNRIAELMALRAETYEKTAHVVIDTDGKSIEAIASEIISKL